MANSIPEIALAQIDSDTGDIDFVSPVSQNGLNEYYLDNNLICAGTNNQIIDSAKCSIINGSSNIIEDKYNCHIIGDYLGHGGITELFDNSFNVGCYNGIKSWGPLEIKRGGAIFNGSLEIKEDSSTATAGIKFSNTELSDYPDSSVRLTQSVGSSAIESLEDFGNYVFQVNSMNRTSENDVYITDGWFTRGLWKELMLVEQVTKNGELVYTTYEPQYSDATINKSSSNIYKNWSFVVLDGTLTVGAWKVKDPDQDTSLASNWEYVTHFFGSGDMMNWLWLEIQTPIFSSSVGIWMYAEAGGAMQDGSWWWTNSSTWPFIYSRANERWFCVNIDASDSVPVNSSTLNVFDNTTLSELSAVHFAESNDPGYDLVIDSTKEDKAGSLIVEGDVKSAFGKIKVGSKIDNLEVSWSSGRGAPDFSAAVGSIYSRLDGTNGNVLYVKEPSGWVPK